MMERLAWLVVVVCICVCWKDQAHAQRKPLSVDGTLAPALDTAGFISMPGTPTPGHLRRTATWGLVYAVDEPQLSGPAGQRVTIERRLRSDLALQLGIGPRLSVAAGFPFVIHQAGDRQVVYDEPSRMVRLAASGIGDLRLQARYRLFGTVADRTGVRSDGPGLGLLFAFDLPTGDPEQHTGGHAARGEFALLADFQVLGAGAAVKLGILHQAEPNHVAGFTLDDRLTYAAAVRVPMPFWPTVAGQVELRGTADLAGNEGAPLELLLGGRLQLGEWTLGISGGIGLTDALGQPAARGVMSLCATPKDPDGDGDGIPDEADTCPFLSEDIDGFEDDDGCEDPDNDNDLVPDVDDLCPNAEALVGRDEDEDGCTDPAAK